MELTALPTMAALGLLAYHLLRTFSELTRITQAPPVVSTVGDARRKELLRRKRRRLEDLREVEFDLRCGCGTGFLNRSVESFPERCVVCGAALDKMRVKRAR